MQGKEKSGIYVIEQAGTGRCYIGSSAAIYKRWYNHRRLLDRGRHHSPLLQHAWTKHGPDAFSFSVLEECPREVLLAREQEYLTAFQPVFNTCTLARSRAGVPHSAESRAKLSASGRARPPFTAEWRANISASRRTSSKARAQTEAALNRAHTPETYAKISASKMGYRHPPEVLARISTTMTGRPANPEAIEAMRAANLGTRHSPESIEKMRHARSAYWAKRRASAG